MYMERPVCTRRPIACDTSRMARAKENPSDPAVTYWVVLTMLVAGGVAVWGWKSMTDKQKKEL